MIISVIIPAWRGIELLRQNLPAILKLKADQVIVVDDASPTNDGEYIKQNFPDVSVLTNAHNLGFGRSVNRGVSQADGDIILLLNQDVNPSKDLLKYLEPDFQDDQVFGVSLAEEQFGPSEGIFANGYIAHRPIKPVPKKPTSTFWVSGGSGAFRKSIWDQLGGFDPLYDPGYWEDVDLCYRALKQGWKLLWDPRAQVEHEHETSFGSKAFGQLRKQRLQERNQLLFTWKNLQDHNLRRQHFAQLVQRVVKHPGYLRIVWAASTRSAMIQTEKTNITDRDLLQVI
jgi:GT2 family glycosyltransferase